MTNDNELVVEEDGVVLYDASDDKEESHTFGLKDNRDIFTQEYMEAFAAESDAKNARLRRNDRLVSVGMILGIVAFSALLAWIFF